MAPTLPRDTDGTFSKFAWPGGYPIFYLFADGGTCCADCANGKNGSDASDTADTDKQWRLEAYDINWEDSGLYCDHCNARIESAYAEEDK